MKKILKRITTLESALRYFDADGKPTDVGNLSGNVSNLRGDVDDCEITQEERREGININNLVSTNGEEK